ncbi:MULTISPECIES: ATP-binding cassette domain-containing protein [Corynebacterium]|uniref:ATP-binding cassette domain-containing protein n=1 Tax=Corynebacterium TaxID=1716 RepID=UPI001CEF5B94|nr:MULTISPECIES: ATP-binding cassette domain-containing protein [Corynebacterium]
MPDPRSHDSQLALEVTDLRCERGSAKKRVPVLKGVNLHIASGEIVAVLGANGAGKTTLINVLSTLLPASSGTARVAGLDVTTQPAEVRRHISMTGQFATVDERLTGAENLIYFARLAGLSRSAATARTTELLSEFQLDAAAHRRVADYSGGMRRRLDIAISLAVPPTLLFLDEPTTGLDPTARAHVWELITRLSNEGTSILLTTQYLDEADSLADRIAVLADGVVIDEGTPAELKGRYGMLICEVSMDSAAHAEKLCMQAHKAGLSAQVEHNCVRAEAPRGYRDLVRLLGLWEGEDSSIVDVALTPPSLDDVYAAIADSGDVAGQHITPSPSSEQPANTGSDRRGRP